MIDPNNRWLKARLPVPKTLKQRQAETGRTLALDGAAWRRLRASVLADEPLCRDCKARGIVTEATEVDHHDNDPKNNDRDNLVPLCKPCHSRKTQADMGKTVRCGCDTCGMPLDPNHPWNKERLPALLRAIQKSPETEPRKPPGPPSVNADCLKNRQS